MLLPMVTRALNVAVSVGEIEGSGDCGGGVEEVGSATEMAPVVEEGLAD